MVGVRSKVKLATNAFPIIISGGRNGGQPATVWEYGLLVVTAGQSDVEEWPSLLQFQPYT